MIVGSRPVLLDLFCGGGGAAVGYARAGFDVVGVDVEPQPEYPFAFIQGDALDFVDDLLQSTVQPYVAVHASPPCQGYTPMTNRRPSHEPLLIPDVRRLLRETDLPYVIENVVGAPLETPARLCGRAFGLPSHRHRLFETPVALWSTPCGLVVDEDIPVYGPPDGRRLWTRTDGTELRAWASVEDGQRALGIDWISDWRTLREAIPPAYTEFIGSQILEHLERAA